jgi:hypothetical protein
MSSAGLVVSMYLTIATNFLDPMFLEIRQKLIDNRQTHRHPDGRSSGPRRTPVRRGIHPGSTRNTLFIYQRRS